MRQGGLTHCPVEILLVFVPQLLKIIDLFLPGSQVSLWWALSPWGVDEHSVMMTPIWLLNGTMQTQVPPPGELGLTAIVVTNL